LRPTFYKDFYPPTRGWDQARAERIALDGVIARERLFELGLEERVRRL
jgi:hypothetical protein